MRHAPHRAHPRRPLVVLVLAAVLLAACGPAPGGAGDGGTPPNACTDATPAAGLAVTTNGAVQGHEVGRTYAWLGIPYAAPPVGDLRFQAPQPPGCLDGTLDAKAFSPECPQRAGSGATGDEDCLYLNVWAPKGGGTGLPVLFFVHGGSNLTGSTSATLLGVHVYEGSRLADAAHAVVVTINYRLGPLGFLALPELAAADPDGSTGNLGLLDQLAALRWAEANVAAFGGDPAKVLLFGESAGAIDTCALYTSPKAKGLFRAALMESGLCDGPFFASLSDRETISQAEATRVGCADPATRLACLRGKTASELIVGMHNGGSNGLIPANWDPTVDGVVLDDIPLSTIAAGKATNVPLVVGTNTEEAGLFIKSVASDADYAAQLHQIFGQTVGDQVLAEYPSASYPSPKAALVQATTDAIFGCPTRRAARAATEAGAPVHRYLFSHTTSGFPPIHGMEIFYVFDDLDAAGINPTLGESRMLDAVENGWAHLAANGDPNGDRVPTWPLYDPATDNALRLDDPMTVAQATDPGHCDFWDGLPAGP